MVLCKSPAEDTCQQCGCDYPFIAAALYLVLSMAMVVGAEETSLPGTTVSYSRIVTDQVSALRNELYARLDNVTTIVGSLLLATEELKATVCELNHSKWTIDFLH